MGNLRYVGPAASSPDAVPTKAQVDEKYTKPALGIPEEDLVPRAQEKLDLANTALQEVPQATATLTGGVRIDETLVSLVDKNGPYYHYTTLCSAGEPGEVPSIPAVALYVSSLETLNNDRDQWTTQTDPIFVDHPLKWAALEEPVRTSLAKGDNSVQKTGSESIDGTKTFSSNPVVPTPTNANHAVTKAYADGKVNNSTGQTLTLWKGTQAQYNAISSKDANTVYVVTA